MRTQGTKYNGFRTVTEIAKDIRRDIKAAVTSGELPSDLKVSVRSRYYAGGQSIDISWSAKRGTHDIICVQHRQQWSECSRYCENTNMVVGLSTHGENIQRTLREIANAYNYDNSDPMTDYFDTLFYCHPQWDWEVNIKGPNMIGDPKISETFATLHFIDGVSAYEALQMARRLEVNA